MEDARKYGTGMEFARKSRYAYDILMRDRLLEKCEFWKENEL